MPPPVDPKLLQREKAALDKVKVASFGVTPRSVPVFGKTEVSWKVELPDSDIEISLELNGAVVAAAGKKSFTLTQTTAFVLKAASEHTGRQLRSVTVQVDKSECRQKNFDAFLVSNIFKGEFDQRFSGSSQLTLRGDKTKVTLTEGTITIRVPLRINVPNFFDANMDILLGLLVGGGGKIGVKLQKLEIDVSWGLLGTLTSLGCTKFVEAGLEEMAKAFLTNIVETELAPRLVKEFTKQADDFTAALKAADPNRRTYQMTLFHVNENGVTITACPK